MKRALEIAGGVAVAEWRGDGALPVPPAPRVMVDVTDRPTAKVGDTYDAQADTFTAPVVPDYGQTVDARAFQRLFTQAERIAIRSSATNDPEVEDYARLAELPIPIRLKHPLTLAGLQLLVSKGLIAQGRVAQISEGTIPGV